MSRSLSVPQAVQRIDRPVFTTREIAAVRSGSVAATSQALGRLERDGLLVRVRRGVWCAPSDPRFTPFALVPFLAGGHAAYVSFLSALHLHGLIDQIPRTVYAATTGHTCERNTPVATYSYHRIDPRLFAGYDWYGDGQAFLVASPEKALVDCLYLSSRRGRRFGSFPELERTPTFSTGRARAWVRRIPDARIRSHVAAKLATLEWSAGSG